MKNYDEKTKIDVLNALAFDGVTKAREIIEIANNESEEKIMEEKMNKMVDNIVKEYNDFKEKMLKNTPAEIFENAFQISTYTDLLYYFENVDLDILIDIIKDAFNNKGDITLFIEHPFILKELYNQFLNVEVASTNSWNDIEDLIKDYIIYTLL